MKGFGEIKTEQYKGYTIVTNGFDCWIEPRPDIPVLRGRRSNVAFLKSIIDREASK